MTNPSRKALFGITALIVGSAMLTALATLAIAKHESWHRVYKGKGSNRTIAVSGEQEKFILTGQWTNIPGAKAKITVPGGERAIILARFTAETVCFNDAPDFCSIRIRVGSREAKPSAGRDFHIDSNYGGEGIESEKGHAMDRSLEVGPGTYTVKVQGLAMQTTDLRVDDWHLTVERVRI